MFTRSDSPLRRRAALAVGAGALALVAGAGVAYAATSSDVVESGWATVVDTDQTTPGQYRTAESGDASRSGDDRDCPGYESGAGSGGGGSSPSTDGSPQTSPDQGGTSEDEAGDL